MNLHFISGLPRSGSTLLAAVLKQNPCVTAGMASPVGYLYQALEDAMSPQKEVAPLLTDEDREAFLRGLFSIRYPSQSGLVFDSNRMWTARLPALAKLFPEAKMICCVRDLAWIMDSFERLNRKYPFEPSGIFGFDTSGTIYDRFGMISGPSGVMGYALNALREALAGEYADRILLVEYDDLCRAPAEILNEIYAFIGEPSFAHDFENVYYSASEFDRRLGAKGLHDIGGRVEKRIRKTILPPDMFARYANDQFWRGNG